jgi:hypothetical protein
VTYFAPESTAAARSLRFKGFWMGYFGFRSAPLGVAPPAVVTATFFNFHPSMVERALPDAWQNASPSDTLDVRAASAAAALRERVPGIERVATDCTLGLEALAEHVSGEGRPLGAANRALEARDDPVERLWQACTTLRELRGDAHVALLVGAGLDGCQSHVIAAAHKGIPLETLRDNRGWTEADWSEATARLAGAGWLGGDETLTTEGQRRRDDIESRTDELAFASTDDLAPALDRIADAARTVWATGVIPAPNPMGLAGPPD